MKTLLTSMCINQRGAGQGIDITALPYLCRVNPNKKKFPKLDAILPSFKHLKLMKSRISARAEFEDVIET